MTSAANANVTALKCGLGALVSGLFFCGLAILIGGATFFAFVGSVVFFWCITLVFCGFAVLVPLYRARSSADRPNGVTWLALAILVLIFPIGFFCATYTFSRISIYSITIVNESASPLESVVLRSHSPEHPRVDPLGTIAPGKRAKVRWDARDEDGVDLRGSWNGRLINQQVVGYTVWEEPQNVTIRIDQTGKVFPDFTQF